MVANRSPQWRGALARLQLKRSAELGARGVGTRQSLADSAVPIIVERLTNDRLHALAELGIEPHAATK